MCCGLDEGGRALTSLTQVGVLYVYLMLVILALGFGLLALRGIDWLIKWTKDKEVKKEGLTKKTEQPWIRLAFISVTVLFLSIFSLGILKTIGVGEGENHNHGQQAGSKINNPNSTALSIQQQLDYLNYQLYQMESTMNQNYVNYPYSY